MLTIKYLQTKKTEYNNVVNLAFLSFFFLFTKNVSSSTSNFTPLSFKVFFYFLLKKKKNIHLQKTKKSTIFKLKNPDKTAPFY